MGIDLGKSSRAPHTYSISANAFLRARLFDAHATRANLRDDFVGAEFCARGDRHIVPTAGCGESIQPRGHFQKNQSRGSQILVSLVIVMWDSKFPVADKTVSQDWVAKNNRVVVD
jgi:hypothetical protein